MPSGKSAGETGRPVEAMPSRGRCSRSASGCRGDPVRSSTRTAPRSAIDHVRPIPTARCEHSCASSPRPIRAGGYRRAHALLVREGYALNRKSAAPLA